MSNLVWPNGLTKDVSTITASGMTQLDSNVVDNIDGAQGGMYEPTADIDISDSAGGGLGDVDVHGQLHLKGSGPARVTVRANFVTTTNNQDIGILYGQILRFDSINAVRDHDMDNTGAVEGDVIEMHKKASMLADIRIHKDGSGYTGNTIVTLSNGIHCSATLYFTDGDWRLCNYSPGATPGPDA